MKEVQIIEKKECRLSNWATLVSRTIASSESNSQKEYHSISQADYISILAVTKDDKIPLVRQFRPALEKYTIELPGGLLEKNEEPEIAVERELFEETGFSLEGELILLGCLAPDSGRLENRLWCFFSNSVSKKNKQSWKAENNVELILLSKKELQQAILNGEFDHALHIAIIGLAIIRQLLHFDPI